MSADFYTSIQIKVPEEQHDAVRKFMEHYTVECHERYRTKRDCWYLLGDATIQPDENGVLDFGFSGPWGIMNGPMFEIDFFERLVDAFPESWFKGTIDGWDAGAECNIEAELKKGKLKLKYYYEEFGEEGDEWTKTYKPQTKK